MIERILVPLDGTAFSEQALPWAAAIALHTGAAVDLAMVEVPSPTAFPDLGFLEPLKDAERAWLRGAEEQLRTAGVSDVSVHLLDGRVPETLEAHRVARGAGLTVLSTHGRGAVARAWLGSVADHFSRLTEAPVLLVRPEAEGGPTLDRLPEVDRIAVTLDGSELSETALEPGMEVARMFGAGLTLIRVIEYPNRTESVYLPDAVDAIDARLAEARAETAAELDEVAARLSTQDVPVDAEARVVIHAADGILTIAGERGVDIIVMASHGRSGLRRLALGSVTDKVLRGAHIPVLVVRGG